MKTEDTHSLPLDQINKEIGDLEQKYTKGTLTSAEANRLRAA